MTPISAIIITFNEEKNISRCIESLQGVADEIVVVDSLSTDSTQQICAQHGVRFISHAFEGYVKQKNWARLQASHQWVLSLDADEALSIELRNSIIEIKQNPTADGYTMNRLNNYCGTWIHHCGWYPDRKLRLWNNAKGEWMGENPHDRFEMPNTSIINHLKGDLLHYTYHTILQHLNQINKFTAIAANERFRKGKNISILLLIFRPLFTFLKKYIIKRGFMDGYNGFVISVLSAYGSFLKDIQLRQLHKNKRDAK